MGTDRIETERRDQRGHVVGMAVGADIGTRRRGLGAVAEAAQINSVYGEVLLQRLHQRLKMDGAAHIAVDEYQHSPAISALARIGYVEAVDSLRALTTNGNRQVSLFA